METKATAQDNFEWRTRGGSKKAERKVQNNTKAEQISNRIYICCMVWVRGGQRETERATDRDRERMTGRETERARESER